jgi:hypothetical protein
MMVHTFSLLGLQTSDVFFFFWWGYIKDSVFTKEVVSAVNSLIPEMLDKTFHKKASVQQMVYVHTYAMLQHATTLNFI